MEKENILMEMVKILIDMKVLKILIKGLWANNEKNGIGRMFYSKGGEYFGIILNTKRKFLKWKKKWRRYVHIHQ